ncbi:MAG: hypothetical protein SFZ23_10445 [Planctomycetota bacterium]|nr:hypothetical protein [Planctomycetota bacterium]
MEGSISETLAPLVRSTKCGTSIWTTFRWLGNIMYGAAWVIALPVELVLNRRIGRRYAGLLPLAISFLVLSFFLGMSSFLSTRGFEGPRTGLGLWGTAIIYGLLAVGLLHQRLGNWWRFRGNEHVYSFSNGIPIWLFLPRPISFRLGQMMTFDRPAPSDDWSNAPISASTPWAAARALLSPFLAHLRAHWSYFFDQWRSGVIPAGPIAWIGATIVHPIIVIALAVPASRLDGGLSTYLVLAGIAIFFKARIEKANAVETVYNVFDSKIEQQFVQAITRPGDMVMVERQGLTAPGIARLPEGHGVIIEQKPQLAPEYAKLLTPDGGSPNPTDAQSPPA